MDAFKKINKSGPGGWNCPCCGPKSTHGTKNKTRRANRRRLKAQDKKEINDG